MGKEIERKFLVCSDEYRLLNVGCEEIVQSYLNRDPDRTVRVRIKGGKGFITVKSRNRGCERDEWEYEIPVSEAREIINRCCVGTIEKIRYFVPSEVDGLVWEVDEFRGRHTGLVVAEIELPDASTPFPLPHFIGEEVTGRSEYYNSSLCSEG